MTLECRGYSSCTALVPLLLASLRAQLSPRRTTRKFANKGNLSRGSRGWTRGAGPRGGWTWGGDQEGWSRGGIHEGAAGRTRAGPIGDREGGDGGLMGSGTGCGGTRRARGGLGCETMVGYQAEDHWGGPGAGTRAG